MAGIEKVCEYSGEYPGWLMYEYKHNSIQVKPEYRKLFRGKEHTLLVFDKSNSSEEGENWVDYALVVPEVPGKVRGIYINWTRDLSATKRKLKRILRAKELNIKRIPMTLSMWYAVERPFDVS